MKRSPGMRIVTIVCLFVWLLTLPLVVGASSDPSLRLEKSMFVPGEEIRVNFHASGSWPRDAWIGIIPSNIPHGSEAVNDRHDITYQYIKNRTHGVMVFTAPGPGQWDLRMHNTDNNGQEMAYVSLHVGHATSTIDDSKLWLEKNEFSPGEQIRVTFHASSSWPRDAWIGIIPSNIPHGSEAVNDQHDITYQYIKNRTHGVMVFTAPGHGHWNLRMHDTDSNGREIASVSFRVR